MHPLLFSPALIGSLEWCPRDLMYALLDVGGAPLQEISLRRTELYLTEPTTASRVQVRVSLC